MNILECGKEVFDIQIEELKKVKEKLGNELEEAAKLIFNSKGKVVITGIGKSGIIGKKIAATMASTGTLTVFMNSAEGLHGDLGMVHSEDVILAISNSGNSDEVVNIIPSINKIGAKIIAMTGNKESKLGRAADIVLNIGVDREACPMNIAPTCSTTATLVMGDTLATVLIKMRNFQPENFAVYHPGGSLGRRLLTKVKDVMHSNANLAIITSEASIEEVIVKMGEKKLGIVCIVEDSELRGIITEGDIRRALSNKEEFFNYKAKDIMIEKFTSITEDKMAIDALELMEERENQISVLPVIEREKLLGVVRLHDVLSVR
ncbi:KpsF/GutQ family sugar-phosphate isomerase [Fusobacteria bacterium ZRK30]|nr:KpsF/GutQ family sugar-phosphate isomerase [Fusobacteria bacterium ZRK30]